MGIVALSVVGKGRPTPWPGRPTGTWYPWGGKGEDRTGVSEPPNWSSGSDSFSTFPGLWKPKVLDTYT